MPKLDCYAILTKLRQNPVTTIIPLIFVTTITRADNRKGMDIGADNYITKPCTVEELLRAMSNDKPIPKYTHAGKDKPNSSSCILHSPSQSQYYHLLALQDRLPRACILSVRLQVE